jgi:hypothetical protein
MSAMTYHFRLQRTDGTPADPPTYRSTVLSWQGDTIPLSTGRFDPDTYSHVLVDHSDKPQTRVYRKRWPGNSTGPRLPLGLLAG